MELKIMKNEQKNNFQNILRPLGFSLLLAAVFLSVNLPRIEAVGNHLDTTFANNGIAVVSFFGDDRAYDVAIQPNGKIVVAGTKDAPGTTDNTDFAVVRLNSNGSPDTTFNSTGTVVTPVLGDGVVNAVAIQPDGKIVVAGRAVVNGIPQFCLVRYNTNGSLDTSFDGNGIVYTRMNSADPNNISEAEDVTVQPDGKIVAVGYSRGLDFSYYEWAIGRYNTNGSPDSTFDGDGKVILDFGTNSQGSAESVIIQPNGRILVGGVGTADIDFVLVRLNSNGLPDNAFGSSGVVITDNTNGIKEIKLLSDGKIVAAAGNNSTLFQMARYNSNGTLDNTFDGDGRLSSSAFGIKTFDIQPDGKIVGVVNVNGQFVSIRINANGTIDAGYGRGGRLTTSIGIISSPESIAIQPDGKPVVVGRTYNDVTNDTNFSIVRYLPDMGKPFDFDGDGKTDISIFRPSNGQWWINQSSNNSTFAAAFGTSSDRITPADFTGDGKTDIALFRPSTGQWFVLRSEDFSFYAFPFGVNGDVPVPGDYDGDGRADAAVFRPSTLTWFIQKSSGGTDIIGFGAANDKPVVGDYDGDGKTDIAIFRPSNGQWWIQRSSGSTVAFTFGISTDKPVPGDYTGDGKTDSAIWRPSSGEWLVLRSENGSFYSYPFGINGDTPAPGDYDGDGRFDTAIFRPSNSTWYVQKTTDGTLILGFGINGDRAVPGAFVP
jgi:uncharacterized delta-60 repeat protein